MSKLTFYYGAMNAGKTTTLIQTAYNYEERGLKVKLLKPLSDTKGNDEVVSRIGLKRKVDYLVDKDEDLIKKLADDLYYTNVIIVDEAQFLTGKQIDELWYIAKRLDVAVIAYGIRTDFKTSLFEGSERLLALADELVEMPTMCSCGSKARFNARMYNGEYVIDGDSILIDGIARDVKYEPLCGKCYIKKVVKR